MFVTKHIKINFDGEIIVLKFIFNFHNWRISKLKICDIYFIKKRTWKTNIAKIIIAVNYFSKTLHRRFLTEFWICLWFWTEYARVLGMCLVLNTPGSWIYDGSEHARIIQDFEYPWIIPEYAWSCLNMSKHAWIYMNMSKYTRTDFVLHFPIVSLA